MHNFERSNKFTHTKQLGKNNLKTFQARKADNLAAAQKHEQLPRC